MGGPDYPPGVTGREDYFYPPECICGGDHPAEGETCSDCGAFNWEGELIDAGAYRELIAEGSLSCHECGGCGEQGDPGDEGRPPSSEPCPVCKDAGRRELVA